MPQTQSDHYQKLRRILTQMFQLDQAELDFGIYRIMNQKREEINDFLDNELLTQIHDTLIRSGDSSLEETRKELKNLERTLRGAGVDVDTNEKVQELRDEIARGGSTETLELEVYSRLTQFFKRYYKEGDFISQRRYKDGVYAIPYEGEEVKLYWANHDQYYIKTGEYFKNYSFKLRNTGTVHFTLKEADTEKDNNKEQSGKERRFQLYGDIPFEEIDGDLNIYFTYEPTDKKTKQDKLNDQGLKTLVEVLPGKWTQELLQLKPTEKNKKRTLLEYRLNDYTAKNSFDYFIHKDLEGFLKRELDFYIKNEILHIDDIDLDDEQHFQKQLLLIKALKKVAHKIIDFLAQIEDFQKKLWLKKKMVVQSDYCITLDRVDEDFYEEIATDEQQHREWIDLFAIDELEDYTEVLSVEFLQHHPFLLLDTQFFRREFKYKLLATLPDIDAQCDGLLINSENFQALNLLQERYREQVKCVYIDPPYNTSENTFVYKNQYKHSSWISMINNRVNTSKNLIRKDGVLEIAIDDTELSNLRLILNNVFGNENYLATFSVQVNPAGQNIRPNAPALSHDYFLVYARNIDKSQINPRPLTKDELKGYSEEDKSGRYYWDNLRRRGGNSRPTDRPNQWFPIYIHPEENRISTKSFENSKEVWPIDPKGIKRIWRYNKEGVEKQISLDEIGLIRVSDEWRISKKSRMPEGKLPKTLWYDSKYSATSQGTRLLQNIFGESGFSYPKSLFLTKDAIYFWSDKDAITLDYFAGSGTTAHAVINLNREDEGHRKYILVEMGEYFNTVTKPRVQKVIYSDAWKNGKPTTRRGSSHCFKYMRLESYEDTLDNLVLEKTGIDEKMREEYLLRYSLDVETRESLLMREAFRRPFGYTIQSTSNNELVETEVDLVETFNYLIGLQVETMEIIRGYVVITGKTLDEKRVLVIWRDMDEHSNADLNEFCQKMRFNPLDYEFHRIYVNGDNNIENMKTGEERWKVKLIEHEFHQRMWEGSKIK